MLSLNPFPGRFFEARNLGEGQLFFIGVDFDVESHKNSVSGQKHQSRWIDRQSAVTCKTTEDSEGRTRRVFSWATAKCWVDPSRWFQLHFVVTANFDNGRWEANII